MATLHELITKVIPLKGILRTPSYWMRKVLMAIADAVEAVKAQADGLQSGKTSMTYYPKSNSVLLQDGNGYVQLFGTRSGDGTMKIYVKDGYDSIYLFGKLVNPVNGIVTYSRTLATRSLYGMLYDNRSTQGRGISAVDLSHFCTNFVTTMDRMFEGCSSLTSLDVSNFDTSAVKGMFGMFQDCSSLTSLDVSNFDTSAVKDMNSMFQDCSSLTSLDVSNFDTSAVKGMNSMFKGCSSLTSLDVSNFDTSAVTNMGYMFQGCTALRNIKCKQAFKDWCTTNASSIHLTVANITWEIVG